MRQYQDYKKRYNLILLVLLITLLTSPISAWGQSAQELQNKIEDKNSEIERLEAEIRKYQGELEILGKQKNSLSNTLKELEITRKKLNNDIGVTQNKIDKTNFKIESLSKDIGNKQSSIVNNLNSIALGIRETNEFENETLVGMILSNTDFTTIWNDIDNVLAVNQHLRQSVLTLREAKVELEDTRTETLVAKKELLSLQAKLSDQKKIVVQNTNETNKILTDTKNSESNYQSLIVAQNARKAALEKEIDDYEAQLKFILNPKSLPGRILSWPLDSVVVTSPFGPRSLGSGYHNGTDFRASVGTPAKAMANGVVVGTGNTDASCPRASFGQWVLIRYDNGLSSTYGHLSLIKVSAGQNVARGQVVAYTGNTGYSTGPHLHVSVYASEGSTGEAGVEVKSLPSRSCVGKILTQPIAATSAYLDPMKFLPPL
jgi:murein DD-endopeptidase MepM/ murein hydrolase activator NlpD